MELFSIRIQRTFQLVSTVSKNEYLHENNQNLNKNGYGNNGGENGGFTGGIKKAPGERPLCRPARDGRDREDAFNPAVG